MQMLRSSRGLLVIGGVLAVVAFVLVLVVVNNNNANKAIVAVAQPTSVPGTPTATPFPTPVLGQVVAIRSVPAQMKFDNMGLVNAYFKTLLLANGATQPIGSVNSLMEWVTTDTHVLSPTTGLFIGTIEITQPITKGSALTTSAYRVLPVAPVGSIAYSLDPGRVAETIQLTNLQAANLKVMPGDFVDLLLTIRQHEVDSLVSNPQASGSSNTQGAVETQQLISNAKIVDVGLPTATGTQVYTVELPLQDALLLKYVKDTFGTVDMVLMSADDVRNETAQPKTHAIFPEYFATPVTIAKGTSQGNGVPNVFVTPRPTPTLAKTNTK